MTIPQSLLLSQSKGFFLVRDSHPNDPTDTGVFADMQKTQMFPAMGQFSFGVFCAVVCVVFGVFPQVASCRF